MKQTILIQCAGFVRRCVVEMKWVAVVFSVLFGLSYPPQVKATEPSVVEDLDVSLAKTASLADLIRYAYQENPSILAAREAWKATVEKYRIETGYPDPQIMVTYFPEPIETRLGPQDWNANISQMIPFPGKLSKVGKIIEADARIARLNLDKTIQNVVMSTRESFHELAYIRMAKRVAEQNLRLLEHLRKVAETAYAQEKTSLIDMVKAQSQNGQLRYDILLLDDLEKTEIARLNGLLNRAPGAEIGEISSEIFQPIVYSLEEIYALSETNQEEIQIADEKVKRAETSVELARYKNFPDFKIGLFYSSIGDPDVLVPPQNAGQDALGIQAGMTIPLWFGKNKSRIGKARAEARKAKAIKANQVNDTITKVRALYFRLENAHRIMDLYGKELLPQAARSMEIAETWFREKESTFSDFIETQAVWYNFQLALSRAQADYGKYLARLERLVGQSITKREDGATEDGGGEK
jgi:outer membrane protein TolC